MDKIFVPTQEEQELEILVDETDLIDESEIDILEAVNL